MQNKTKVLVIGLDGGTWNIIKPLVEKGKLPTIARLMNGGCYGDLESCIPPVTFPAWKCYSTGKNPGKLGAYGFFRVDRSNERFIFHNSTSFKSKELWDYLGENNITCGVLDMPTTHPCKGINGFMISHGSPRSSGYTHPPELEKELADKFAYRVEPEYSFDFGKDAAVSSLKSMVKQRFAVADYLVNRFAPSFFQLAVFYIDPVQHHCWRDMEEGDTKYGGVIEDFWILIDDGIRRLLDESCNEDTYVLLMSDHGFTGKKGALPIGEWLAERGLLKLTKSRSFLSDLLFRSWFNVLQATGHSKPLLSLLRLLFPRKIREKFGSSLPAIDWNRTKVIHNCGGLYINRNCLSSEQEYEELRERLATEIKEVEDPETREKPVSGVRKGEEIFFGSYVDQAPDAVIMLKEGYEIIGRAGFREEWLPQSHRWTGVHKLEGIFLACGPGIRRGTEIQGAKIYDLAPTILHLFGLPIPKDMDGRVLKEIFEPDSALAKREIEYQELDEQTRVREKIRELKTRGKV